MLALLTLATVLAQAPLIDFVTVPPDQGEERQATYKFGGRPFHDPSPKKTLPLEIELLSISRPPGQPLAVIVEMNVRNVGPGPFLLPVGKDGNRAMKPANRGRQELSFALRGQGEPGMCGAGLSAFGSTDLPASLHTIPPGGAVRLRFAAEFSYQRLEQWRTKGELAPAVEAGLIVYRYDDNPKQYVVDTTDTPPVFSRNAIRVPLQ
jgi:hypothetical protein